MECGEGGVERNSDFRAIGFDEFQRTATGCGGIVTIIIGCAIIVNMLEANARNGDCIKCRRRVGNIAEAEIFNINGQFRVLIRCRRCATRRVRLAVGLPVVKRPAFS